MALFKCKMCGGALEINNNETVAVCEYCGTKQTLPSTNDEVITNLFNRANNLRLKCEFDKAAQIYEKIVQEDDSQAEAHWGIVLCKYGIEYVQDPQTNKRIPTCHRTLFEAVTTDTDYIAAIDYSDTVQQEIYEQEARAIDKIQRDVLSIVKKEEPFDVFICYKETDTDGKRTVDSVIANDIYHQLTQEGLKVFYAAITLEDKLGQEYEPYIFAALNSAKVMLVVGTKPEYFNAVWVRNEWSRFLKLIKTSSSKLLIPCYRDMDAYDLPEEFAHLQAQDMGKIGFINDIVRGINKIIEKSSANSAEQKTTETVGVVTPTVDPLLKRAFLFLEDGDFAKADDFCEQVLNLDPENAQAYLGKLLVELRVKNKEQLKECADSFEQNSNYQKVLRFGDDDLKQTLNDYVNYINERNEKNRLEDAYLHAKSLMNYYYDDAAQAFEKLGNYKDSDYLKEECLVKAEETRRLGIYSNGISLMRFADIAKYEKAIELFKSITGFKDADERIIECQNQIEELKAKAEAERLERERQAEIKRKKAEKRAKRNKKIAIITTPIVCAVIAFIIVLNTVIIPNGKYNDAIALMDAGKLDEAYSAFIELGDYKDASEKAGDIRLQKTKDQLKNIKVGSHINFGAYEQDNNTSNGKEDVEWLVLEIKDGKALVISKYALDCKQYNITIFADVTWETCTLRKWLNNDFINAAFSADEKSMITTVTVSADKNPEHSTNPGNATQDQVFLLSITEAYKYFNSDSTRQCKPTDYAVANGADVNSISSNCWWWLRSPGYDQNVAAFVRDVGDVYEGGYYVDNDNRAVRPALWIDLEDYLMV